MSGRLPVEPIFDQTPHLFDDGPPDPVVYDASARALRQRTVNFAAKRYADMMFVGGLDRATADRHFRPRAALVPGGLSGRPAGLNVQDALTLAVRDGRFAVHTDAADRRATVTWTDSGFGDPITGQAIARAGYGGIVLGQQTAPRFEPRRLSRDTSAAAKPWPVGGAVEPLASVPSAMTAALDAFMASSSGVYGVVIGTPDRVLVERYSAFGTPDRATPSWSMTKAITCTLVGRMIHEGWFHSIHDPAPAPLWRDPRDIHRLITLDHLVRMRAGIGFPVRHGDGSVTLGFENSAVYQDGVDAFDMAQRMIVATLPGSVFRYVNSGMNVLGAVIRSQIEKRGLPYHRTVYEMLADRLGMSSYQHSADIAGNFIGSGAGFATARDYAKLGVLYVNDGVWNGERLLPPGWVDYATTSTHTGTSYAACFRTNIDHRFPSLPVETAWAAGASDNRVFILRRHRLSVAVTNETDHPMDLAALDRMIAIAIDSFA
ncbi:MAG: class C beta-lactamase-related serine hydrolase [Acetobacteraceae bacterium]|nr:class C beta-lactamase-related serine hydrolase [Acetobacteraceae bacterium]